MLSTFATEAYNPCFWFAIKKDAWYWALRDSLTFCTFLLLTRYCKLLLLSPRPFVTTSWGVLGRLINGTGGGGGACKWAKKAFKNKWLSSADQNTFWSDISKHHKKLNPCQLYPGGVGGWGVYNQMYFLFTSWWVYNRWGYKRKFTVYKNNWNYYLAVDHRSSKH